MFHDLSGALEGTHLGDACDIAPIPLDAKFKILVRIKTLGVDSEASH
jgi:hypothetical protein